MCYKWLPYYRINGGYDRRDQDKTVHLLWLMFGDVMDCNIAITIQTICNWPRVNIVHSIVVTSVRTTYNVQLVYTSPSPRKLFGKLYG